jgi:DNA (cytosine-5)-methyltransferase 1
VRPRLLDLFCCEGGASEGYRRAGFDVYGNDLFEKFTRKRYPFPAYTGDALLTLHVLLEQGTLPFTNRDGTVERLGLEDFAAVGGSPPCQFYSITRHSHSNKHPDLLGPVRWLVRATGLPYVLENVPGAPMHNPLILCGTMFDLTAADPDGRKLHLRRHRLFESNIPLWGPGVPCRCAEFRRAGIGVGGAYGGGSVDRAYAKNVRRGGYTPPKPVREALLGVDWMTQNGLSQCIPPAYTEFVGRQVLEHVSEVAA